MEQKIKQLVPDNIQERTLMNRQAVSWVSLNIKILKTINKSKTLKDCIEIILDEIKQSSGFNAVGIRFQEDEDFPYFVTKGFSSHFIEAENFFMHSRPQR